LVPFFLWEDGLLTDVTWIDERVGGSMDWKAAVSGGLDSGSRRDWDWDDGWMVIMVKESWLCASVGIE
jgi:hypothetical protein